MAFDSMLRWHENGVDIRRADWDDLNLPARMPTLAVSGLPRIQRDNCGAQVAIQSICRESNLGLFFTPIPDLAEQPHDRQRVALLRQSVTRQRETFMFDTHADQLMSFFRSVITARGSNMFRENGRLSRGRLTFAAASTGIAPAIRHA